MTVDDEAHKQARRQHILGFCSPGWRKDAQLLFDRLDKSEPKSAPEPGPQRPVLPERMERDEKPSQRRRDQGDVEMNDIFRSVPAPKFPKPRD